ncbi:hypothetical protein EON65_06655 [archaeon]|nr:MAG: hypothetical protein EON65_06655 [archaeon]
MSDVAKVAIYGENPHECGYCKSGNPVGSISYGVEIKKMKAHEYEKFMLKGWRRSGTYFYRFLLHKTCCPAYTIRLNANNFKPTKSQKKVLRKATQPNPNNKGNSANSMAQDSSGQDITIETQPTSFTEEKFALYKKYQVTVHQDKPDEVTPEGFTRFLISSPLVMESDGTKRYGSFHQLYRLNGVLIAVGVVDLLPSGLSSVYCFYDPDYRSLVLGKYSALKEIEYCQQNGFEYYYMGYYIHSCEKMRYKGEYAPSELLCPTTSTWHPLDEVKPLLDRFKFTPLDPAKAQERAALGEAATEAQLDAFLPMPNSLKQDVQKLRIHSDLHGDFTFSELTKSSQATLAPILGRWVRWAGSDVALSMVVSFS